MAAQEKGPGPGSAGPSPVTSDPSSATDRRRVLTYLGGIGSLFLARCVLELPELSKGEQPARDRGPAFWEGPVSRPEGPIKDSQGLDGPRLEASLQPDTLKPDSCGATCTGACTTTCTGGCQSTCTGGCQGSCTDSCTGGCGTGCASGCQAVCSDNCTDKCTAACKYDCTGGCMTCCKGAFQAAC